MRYCSCYSTRPPYGFLCFDVLVPSRPSDDQAGRVPPPHPGSGRHLRPEGRRMCRRLDLRRIQEVLLQRLPEELRGTAVRRSVLKHTVLGNPGNIPRTTESLIGYIHILFPSLETGSWKYSKNYWIPSQIFTHISPWSGDGFLPDPYHAVIAVYYSGTLRVRLTCRPLPSCPTQQPSCRPWTRAPWPCASSRSAARFRRARPRARVPGRAHVSSRPCAARTASHTTTRACWR